ncbi:MAG: alginate export family protein [Verrucomicrobiota bacterium]
MKKACLVIALTALGGLATNTLADVQNIRLSGDIRTRGYYLTDAAESSGSSKDQLQSSSFFIEQRTRVCVEADLEDHVLVVVTLQAQGLWGDSSSANSSGAGTEDDAGTSINRSWSTGVSEAYLQLNEVFYSPATLKVGRQFLNYGRGLILSSVEQEYNYDAGRLVLDYYPLTLDIVGARIADQGSFGGDSFHPNANLLFVNARYEMSDSLIKDVEGYFGWLGQSSQGGATTTQAPPTANGASPMIIGLRSDMNLTEGLTTWIEGAYEFGQNGNVSTGHISAWLANAGLRFSMKDTKMAPVFNASYTFASGGGTSGQKNFVPWFDYVDGYNGYLFCPILSNIHIFNVGATVKTWENATFSLQGYYYMAADKDSFAGSNPNIDFGGLEFTREAGQSGSRDLGWEVDAIMGYDYSKDVRFQVVNAFFIPENAYTKSPLVSQVAHELRGEVSVKF